MMVEEIEWRNYSAGTIRYYARFVERFAQHFGESPDKLGLEHVCKYQAYLLRERKLCPGSVEHHLAARPSGATAHLCSNVTGAAPRLTSRQGLLYKVGA